MTFLFETGCQRACVCVCVFRDETKTLIITCHKACEEKSRSVHYKSSIIWTGNFNRCSQCRLFHERVRLKRGRRYEQTNQWHFLLLVLKVCRHPVKVMPEFTSGRLASRQWDLCRWSKTTVVSDFLLHLSPSQDDHLLTQQIDHVSSLLLLLMSRERLVGTGECVLINYEFLLRTRLRER